MQSIKQKTRSFFATNNVIKSVVQWRQHWRLKIGLQQMVVFGIFEVIRDSCFYVLRKGYSKHTPMVICLPTRLNTQIREVCKDEFDDINIPFWARGPFAQTVLSNLKYKKFPELFWHEERILAQDGGSHSLAWLDMEPDVTRNTHTPIVFCAHGLGGGLQSTYIKILASLCLEKRWKLVIHIRRGHNATLSKGHPPTHAGIEDMNQAVHIVRSAFPYAPKIAVGFSAGGNVIAMHQGLHGNNSAFIGAATFSAAGGEFVHGTQIVTSIADRILVGYMLAGLKTKEAFAHIFKDPPDSLRKLDSIIHNEINPDQYYKINSSFYKLQTVRKPLLCVSSMDDPIIPGALFQYHIDAALKNENIIAVQTQNGGHVGWFKGNNKSPWWLDVFERYVTFLLQNNVHNS